MRILFSILIAFCISHTGLSKEYSLENMNIKDGLPNSIVNCMVQDDQGFLWIGTSNGLCRYDGYNFELIPLINNADENITNLKLSSENHLWITTLGGNLSYYNTKLESFISLDFGQSAKVLEINAFEVQNDTILWIGTRNGLRKYIATKKGSNEIAIHQSEVLLPDPAIIRSNNNFIAYLKKHKDGKSLWVGTNSGLFKLNTQINYFKRINTGNKATVRYINQISNDHLIIGFWNSGILQIDNEGNMKTNPFIEYIEKVVGGFRVLSVLSENDDSYWIGTRENGVFNFTVVNDSISSRQFKFNATGVESLGSNLVSCLLKDRSDVIWIGQMNAGGLSKIVSGRYHLKHIEETACLNVNSIFVQSPNKIWLGTNANGLIFLDLQSNNKIVLKKSSQPQTNLESNIIQKIHEDNAGNLWIGTHGKGVKIITKKMVEAIEENRVSNNEIDFISLNKILFPDFSNYIWDICSDQNGNIWIGTQRGLFFVNRKFIPAEIKKISALNQQKMVQNYFKNNKVFEKLIVFSLYIDHSGFLWVSSQDKGLLKIDTNNNHSAKAQVFNYNETDSNSLQSNKVFNCRQDSHNRLWVTSAKGLDIIDLNDYSVKPVLSTTNIGNNELLNLTFDRQGTCWLGLSYGIYSYNPVNDEIKKYYRASIYGNFNNPNALHNSGDSLIYMGTRDGITFFNPNSISNTALDIPFYITSFKINNIKVKPGKKVNGRIILTENINETSGITLKSNDHHIAFDIASLDFFDRSSIEYKYILEGATPRWITLNKMQHTLSFTNLRKGDYTLRIKATNSEGAWDSKEIRLKIKVLPPFLQSNIAIVIYSILLLVLLYLFWMYTIIRENEKNKLKLIQVEKEKSEELNNLKLQFFTNISHEFKTPLSLILTPLEIILNKVKNSDTRQQLTLIQRNANRLLFLINQILDIRKLDAGKINLSSEPVNLSDFSSDIFTLFQPLARKKQIDFTFQETDEKICVNIDKHYMESVLYNILSNAFRFTKGGGNINIKVFTSGQYACVSVKDSGKGIPKIEISKIFERFYHSSEKGKEWISAGIGLSFSKSIVDMHNGDIEVKSEEGKRSIFIIKLPLMQPHLLPEKETVTQAVSKNIIHGLDSVIFENSDNENRLYSSVKSNEKEFSILVVEDNQDLRNFIFDQLKVKYNVFIAENGKKGWEMVQSKQPDLVITDLMMPEMDGMELCELIKNSDSFNHIPVIMLTAKNLEEDKIEGYKTGADAYIFKPFIFNFLSLRIENLLNFKRKVKNQLSDNLYFQTNNKFESRDKIFIDKTIALVEENISNSEFNVDAMYKSLGYSRTNLYRRIKELTNYSVKEFVREIRLQHAAQMFRNNDITVNEVAYSTGFESVSYFSKCFKKKFNLTPVEYKSKHYTHTRFEI